MFDLLNNLKNIEAGHITRRRKLPHSTLIRLAQLELFPVAYNHRLA